MRCMNCRCLTSWALGNRCSMWRALALPSCGILQPRLRQDLNKMSAPLLRRCPMPSKSVGSGRENPLDRVTFAGVSEEELARTRIIDETHLSMQALALLDLAREVPVNWQNHLAVPSRQSWRTGVVGVRVGRVENKLWRIQCGIVVMVLKLKDSRTL